MVKQNGTVAEVQCLQASVDSRTHMHSHTPTGHTYVYTQPLGGHSTPTLTHSTEHLLPWTRPLSRWEPRGRTCLASPSDGGRVDGQAAGAVGTGF